MKQSVLMARSRRVLSALLLCGGLTGTVLASDKPAGGLALPAAQPGKAGLPQPLGKQAYYALQMGVCAAENVERALAGDAAAWDGQRGLLPSDLFPHLRRMANPE